MVETINASTQAVMDAGFTPHRSLMKIELPSGTYGFWNGAGTVSYDGTLYQGAGSILSVDAYESSSDGSAISVRAEMNSIANTELTPDVLAGIFDEEYSQKPVTCYTQFINPETRAVTQTEVEWAGYIDTIEEERTTGGQSKLVMTMESRSRDFSKRGARKRNDADQREINPDDGSFRHAQIAAEQPVLWGRASQDAPSSGLGGPLF